MKYVQLTLREVLRHLPTDMSRRPEGADNEVGFYLDAASAIALGVEDNNPVYTDPSHLAAWAHGYLQASNELATNEKGDK